MVISRLLTSRALNFLSGFKGKWILDNSSTKQVSPHEFGYLSKIENYTEVAIINDRLVLLTESGYHESIFNLSLENTIDIIEQNP